MKIVMLALVLVTVCLLTVASQKPRFYLNREYAMVAFFKGGYRSWKISYSDGLAYSPTTGKFHPVVISTNGVIRKGYRWPQFHYTDLRELEKRLGGIP